MEYKTADSRLCAFLMANEVALIGTELAYHGDEDRVYFKFNVDEQRILELKRAFFEGASCPALPLLNFAKTAMHMVRECRELARQYKPQ